MTGPSGSSILRNLQAAIAKLPPPPPEYPDIPAAAIKAAAAAMKDLMLRFPARPPYGPPTMAPSLEEVATQALGAGAPHMPLASPDEALAAALRRAEVAEASIARARRVARSAAAIQTLPDETPAGIGEALANLGRAVLAALDETQETR